jgi:ABC-type glycerol-3-phosphate transport system substrate-binding protein/transcriptional regulator with XRE-family HTH domain
VTVAGFAARLAELRSAAGLSLTQLAELTHYNKASLSKAANGQRLPAWPLAEQYVRHCGGDVSAFEKLWRQLAHSGNPTTTRTDTIESPESPAPASPPDEAVEAPQPADLSAPHREHRGMVEGQPRRARGPGNPLARWALLSLCLLLAAALGAALGQVILGDGADADSSQAPSESPGPSPSVTPGSDVLVVMGPWNADNPAEMHMIEEVLQRFTEDEGTLHAYLRPKHTQDFAEYYLGKQGVPDVTLMPQPALMHCAQARKQIQILPPEVAGVVGDYPDKSWTEKGKINKDLYGVVFKSGDKSRVWYNRALLEEAGISPATLQTWTWDEFQQKLSELDTDLGPERSALAVGAKQNEWVLTDWFENIYARVVGGDYESLANRRPDAWKGPAVLETLEKMRQLMGPQGKIKPFELTRSEALESLREGKAAMIVGDFAKDLADEEKFGSVPFPADADPNKVIHGADIAVLNRDSKQANELLKFLGTQRAADTLAKHGYTSPRTQPADPQADDVFDLSDQLPSDFGSRPQQGMQKILTELVAKQGGNPGTARNDLASGVGASGSTCPKAP